MRALVVDDSSAMRSVLRMIFRKAGFEVTEASNGYEALNRLAEIAAPVDLAVIDWNMPLMNGYELVSAIRSETQYNAMRIMMVTTESEIGHMGQDGLRGAEKIRDAGGQILAQDEESSVVWGMPGFVANAGLADAVLPLDQIGPEMVRRVTQSQRRLPA
jgi:two-component system, chemotaxis family, chemotaxis protein CheY